MNMVKQPPFGSPTFRFVATGLIGEAAQEIARETIAHAESHPPAFVAQAVKTLLHPFKTLQTGDLAQPVQELVSVLENNLQRLEQNEATAKRELAYRITTELLGWCHGLAGDIGAAVDDYTRGLQINPNEVGLLIRRGTLQYGASPRAISDLERAVQLGASSVWPYFFLAHHYGTTNRFDQARVVCEKGLTLPASNAVKSRLEEMRAIALAELGFPSEVVRASFETAIRLDPTNEQAKRNQKTFEQTPRFHPSGERRKWEQRVDRAVRQFGLAERLAEGEFIGAA